MQVFGAAPRSYLDTVPLSPPLAPSIHHCSDLPGTNVRCTEYLYDQFINLAQQSKRFYPALGSVVQTGSPQFSTTAMSGLLKIDRAEYYRHSGEPCGGYLVMNDIAEQQRELCRKYGSVWIPAPEHLKVGIAKNVRESLQPINGLRHQPAGDTTGWYIWAGAEPSSDPTFFVPLHVSHLAEWRPAILRFLGLAPGWRFLMAGGHVDVWEDPMLLKG